MRFNLILFTTLCAAAVMCSAGSVNQQHWAERSLRTAVKGGVHRVLEQQVHLPTSVRTEIEDIVVNRLSDHLLTQINELNSIVTGCFAIAKDFINSAVKSASTRTRWPTEQIIHHLETEVGEAEQKKREFLLQHPIPSSGLLASVEPSSNQISEVNLEQIIADVISNLMTDEGFLYLIHWLDTLPSVVHGIADEFLANKTFQQIFAMISSRSEQVQGMMVQGLVVQDLPADTATGNAKRSKSESVLGLVGAGLKDARSIVQLVSRTYRQILNMEIAELNKLVDELGQKMPYIPVDVMNYIRTSALELMSFKSE